MDPHWEWHPPTDDEVLHAGNNLNPQRNQAIGLSIVYSKKEERNEYIE